MARTDTMRCRVRRLPALLALATLAGGAVAQDRPPEKVAPRKMSRQGALERFRDLTPHERLQRAEKAAGAKAFVPVSRGELDLSIVERGSLDSAEVSDVVCRVKGKTTIKWLIDDGSLVKKGQRLAELDDSELRDRLRTQEVACDRAAGTRLLAEANLKLLRNERKLDARAAELDLKIARLELKQFAGKDAEKKELLELKVERAQLAVEAVELRGRSKEILAEADVKEAVLGEKQQAKRKAEIEAQVAECVLTAPQAGLVVYHLPEMGRLGPAGALVAQGEPVREGQKLLRVCGLDRFTLLTRIHEAFVSRVRPQQQATVRIDAFPGRDLRARIKEVSPVASRRDWLANDVKVYPAVVELIDQLPGLKPGLSGEINVEGPRRPKALLVPAEAVLQAGRQAYCYVRTANGAEERKVTIAARNSRFAEIKEGLQEAEPVLRDPAAAARSVAP
jgi:multidrug efflux pump subunit AcrA (membrane-fusion protein)